MLFRIKRRGISKFGLALAGTLGVVGGVYIWKPIFEEKLAKKIEADSLKLQQGVKNNGNGTLTGETNSQDN